MLMSCGGDAMSCSKVGSRHVLTPASTPGGRLQPTPGLALEAVARDAANPPRSKRARRHSGSSTSEAQADSEQFQLDSEQLQLGAENGGKGKLWVWEEDDKPLPTLHPDNDGCRVVCSGTKNDRYTVDLLWHAYRIAAKRSGIELRENFELRARVKTAAEKYRESYADMMALRVVRGELSLTRVRSFVSDQRHNELNHLLSFRIQPSLNSVVDRVRALRLATRSLGVKTIRGINGEAGLWPVSSILNTVLCNEMLRRAVQCPIRTDCLAIQFDARYFRACVPQEDSEGEQIQHVLRFLNVPSPGADSRNLIRLPSERSSTVTVILFNVGREHLEEQLRIRNQLHVTCPWTGAGDKPDQPVIALKDVYDMTVRCMIDAGARIGRTITGKTGQTLEIVSLKWMRGLWESVVCNAFPSLAFSGADSHQNYNAYCEELRLDKLDLVSHPYTHDDNVYIVTIEHGGDGACRRNLQGNVSVSGHFKNEQCTVHKHNIKLETSPYHQCEERQLDDALQTDAETHTATCTLGQITVGALVSFFSLLVKCARMLWMETNLAMVMPVFNRGGESIDLSISDEQAYKHIAAETSTHFYSKLQQLEVIEGWLDTSSQFMPAMSKVKKNLLKKRAEQEDALWLKTAEKSISHLDQEYRAGGHGKVALLGLEPTLQLLISGIDNCHRILKQQKAKAQRAGYAEHMQHAIKQLLQVEERDGTCDIYSTFEQADNIRGVAASLLKTIEVERKRTQHTRPMLTEDTLLSLRKFCRSVGREKSPLNLYGLAAGGGGTLEIVTKHMYKVSNGMTDTMTFERPMMLGVLHVFTIRGWATLLCHIGITCWALGCGRKFCKSLIKNGVPCHYFERFKTMMFGGIKSKGHDSLKIMLNPHLFCESINESHRDRIADIISLWSAMWFIISCGWIGNEACHMFNDPSDHKPAQFTPRQQAENAVRKIAGALDNLLHGIFGTGSIWTPTIHTAVHDVVKWYCDEHQDLWFGNEQSIESSQQQARNLLYSLQSSTQKNTDMILHWIAWQLASYKVAEPTKRQAAGIKRQLKSWNLKRWPRVQQALKLLPKYTDPVGESVPDKRMWEYLPGEVSPWHMYSTARSWRESTPSLEKLLTEYDSSLRPVLATSEQSEEQIRKKAAKKLKAAQAANKQADKPATSTSQKAKPGTNGSAAPSQSATRARKKRKTSAPTPAPAAAAASAAAAAVSPVDAVSAPTPAPAAPAAPAPAASSVDAQSTPEVESDADESEDSALELLGIDPEEEEDGAEMQRELSDAMDSAMDEALQELTTHGHSDAAADDDDDDEKEDEDEEEEEEEEEAKYVQPYSHKKGELFSEQEFNLVAYISTKHRPVDAAPETTVVKDRAVDDLVLVEYRLLAKMDLYNAKVIKVNDDRTVDVEFYDKEIREGVPLSQVHDLPERGARGQGGAASAAQMAQVLQAELDEFEAREQWGGGGSGTVVYGLISHAALTEEMEDIVYRPGDVVVQPLCAVPSKTDQFKVVGSDESRRHLVLASEILHGHFAPPLTVRSERMNFRAYNIPSEVQQEARRRQRKLKQQAS
jgi:hypothetical protein